jgi:DNA-binding NtrC family response regulator
MEPKPSVLIVDDDSVMCLTLSDVLKKMSYEVRSAASGTEALEHIKEWRFDVVLLDIRLPDINGLDVLHKIREVDSECFVIVMTAYADVKSAVAAMKAGAYDYVNKPFELDELRLAIEKAMETKELKGEVLRLRYHQKSNNTPDEIVGVSPEIDVVRELITLVSQTPRTPVLIQGESGTGKELVANAVHSNSQRIHKPMMKINCAAIPETLLEAELFGYEQGAFTDARESRPGLIELAHGGTVFLDEISEMKASLQPKLLRFLETYTLRRVGGKRDTHVDVRIVASTNRDLSVLVKKGEFRKDLYYRIKVMVIEIPPLRDRQEDVPALLEHFVGRLNRELGREVSGLTDDALHALLLYPWPGNVRELKNVVERAMILVESDRIAREHLPLEIREHRVGSQQVDSPVAGYFEGNGFPTLASVVRDYILQVLKAHKGNKSETARILGISRSTLREKLLRYGLMS